MNRKKHADPAPATEPAPVSEASAPAPAAVPLPSEPPIVAAPESAATPPSAAARTTPAPSPAEIELAALQDKHLRLQADFDNFRKRQARDRDEQTRRATESLMRELLPALDHLELALANAPDRNAPLATGVQMVFDQFLAALARFALTPFPSVGEPFDPTRHEAVAEQPSLEVPAQRVLIQLRRGYMLGGHLLRAAQVVVSSGPAAPRAADTPVCDGSPEKES